MSQAELARVYMLRTKCQCIVTGFSAGTLAVESGQSVVACTAVKAGTIGAVIYVDATVEVCPAVDADAVEAAELVDARAAVPTRA